MTRQAVFRLKKNLLPNLHVFKNLHTLFKNNGLELEKILQTAERNSPFRTLNEERS